MATYPGATSSDTNLYLAKNNLATTLNGALNNSATTVPVTSTTGFPASGIITIDLEAIAYTSLDATNFLGCTRGFDGTTAASHTSLTQVFHNVVAIHHNAPKDEIIALEADLRAAFGTVTPAGPNATDTSMENRIKSLTQVLKNITGNTLWNDAVTVNLLNKLSLAGGTMSGAIAMGNNKITGLADGTAGGDAAAFGQVKIRQVLVNTQTSGTTTTSSTFQNTNLARSITPSSVNNKVLVICVGALGITANNREAEATIFNTTQNYNLFSTHGQGYVYPNLGTTVTSFEVPCTMVYLDSPAATTSQEYRVKLRSVDNATTASWSSANSITESIILIEVAP